MNTSPQSIALGRFWKRLLTLGFSVILSTLTVSASAVVSCSTSPGPLIGGQLPAGDQLPQWSEYVSALETPSLTAQSKGVQARSLDIPMSGVADVRAEADTCKCSCGGLDWSPGAIACMGGFKHRCVARAGNSNCGWDPVMSGSDQVRCDGGEHCK
jgi:hypothetical protein